MKTPAVGKSVDGVASEQFKPHLKAEANMQSRIESVEKILTALQKSGSKKNIEGMAHFGITSSKAFGVSTPKIKLMAKKIGRNHDLALELWKTGYLEARAIAFLIADPILVTPALMNRWVRDFDSWAVCDGTCGNLFRKTVCAYDKIFEWAGHKEEYVRRASFALMAQLAVHDKKRNDADFLPFLDLIETYSTDERNFVKKAVNWALRSIGKRSFYLNKEAVNCANKILSIESKSARWIARDAVRELTDSKVLKRLKR
jgi:3-methyladenine DNA glycosylase AlkD